MFDQLAIDYEEKTHRRRVLIKNQNLVVGMCSFTSEGKPKHIVSSFVIGASDVNTVSNHVDGLNLTMKLNLSELQS